MIITPPSAGGGIGAFTVLQAQASVALIAGNIVFADNTGEWALARANNVTATRAYGFIIKNAASSFAGSAINSGQIDLTTAQWDAVIEGAGTGGLTPGTQYYLSEAVAGQITDTPVSTGFRVPVGKAITDQKMAVAIEECIQLAA